MNITLTIIIPCYNHGAYLLEALESTGVREHAFCEVIIVNDGSTDPTTLEVLAGIDQERVRVLHQENQGVGRARNNGMREARGEFILLLDADNTILPDYYLQAMEVFRARPEVTIAYSNYIRFGEGIEESVVELPEFSSDRLLAGNFIDTCAIFRTSLFRSLGGFDENRTIMGYEDWEHWIRSWGSGAVFHHLKEPLYRYRVVAGSMLSMANEREARRSRVEYLLTKHAGLYRENVKGVLLYYLDFLMHNEEVVRVEKGRNVQLEDRIVSVTHQNEKALSSIFNLQARINRIEASKPYKLYKQLRHLKNLLRSNSSGNERSHFLKKFVFLLGRKGRAFAMRFMAKIFKHLYLWTEERKVYIIESGDLAHGGFGDPYDRWLMLNLPTESKLLAHRKEIASFRKQPKFSIVMPVYNVKEEHFSAAVDSILSQVYENWELCIADDRSTDRHVARLIKEYVKRDHRIKAVFREENGHISAASNSALELATGDYIVLMDQDDLITPDALYQNAKVINEHEQVHLIYSDEDKIDDNGKHSYPHFKPDWSPDNLLSRNYLGHLTVFDADIMRTIGGWREGFEGSQDYDLVLRFTERTNAIFHIPKVLYHWRIHDSSAAAGEEAKPYAYIAAKKALTEALVRRNETGTVDFLDGFRGYSVRFDLKAGPRKVSIIIPTKDKTDLLQQCVKSIFERSTHQDVEVVVVDNNSSEREFFAYIGTATAAYGDRFRCVKADMPFNFSALVNFGVKHSTGDYIVLLNNDTEVITPDWLEGLMEQAQRPSIGVVGVKLLYPNETIQHAGVVMGLGGAAGHVLVGEDRRGPGYFNYVNMLNNYSALTAACIMVRRSLYERMNGFDESFAVEYNDVDFCLRIRESGLNNVYVPHVELFHHESMSRGHPHATSESYARHLAEIARLQERWGAYIDHDPCYNPNLTLGAHDFSLRH
ncbi:MAG TPA: glycosyltransferase [Flavobacteriales bacterium]